LKWLVQVSESALWHSRLLILAGVIAGVVLALGAFYMAAVDVAYLPGKLSTYADPRLDTTSRAAYVVDVDFY
jgi:uncharacterized membrane protein YqhA